VNDKRRGAVQSAYQVIVASGKPNIERHEGDLWDSGKVGSGQSIDIEYAGRPLRGGSIYWWAVRTWDADGKPSPWSEPQRINIGEAAPGEAFYSDQWVESDLLEPGEKVRMNRHTLETHIIQPVKIINKAEGHYFIDFGRAAFGTLRLTVTSDSENHEMEIRLGEMRGPDYMVETDPGGSVVYQKIVLPLKQGTHTYRLELPHKKIGVQMPEHIGEVIPFRYCEIIGSPSEINAGNVAQMAVFYKFNDEAASFTCSDPMLNDVWELCKYSIKATTFLGIYIDGQRERKPYEADAYINQLGHYCVDREYAMARYSHEYLIHRPTWPTEWILHSVLIAWADYMYTGNLDSVIRCYDDLKAKTLIALEREDGLISTHGGLMTKALLESVHFAGNALKDVVDWPQPSETDGYVFTKINTVVNAFHYRALVLMGRIALAVGKSDDAAFFAGRAERVYGTFNEKLFDPVNGVYRDGEGADHASLHSNMFALAMGLVDEKRKPSVVKFIKSRGMACSVYGAQHLLEALYEADEADTALRLMTALDDRSWPHMIHNVGSTITLEAWDKRYKPNLDWNHAWGAAPANIIPRLLVGVEPIEHGFKKIRIRPQIGWINNLSARVPTIRGEISVSIWKDSAGYHLRCRVPANTRAEVHLPDSNPALVTESGKPVDAAEGVSFNRTERGRAVFEIGAGEYDFLVKTQ